MNRGFKSAGPVRIRDEAVCTLHNVRSAVYPFFVCPITEYLQEPEEVTVTLSLSPGVRGTDHHTLTTWVSVVSMITSLQYQLLCEPDDLSTNRLGTN
ncbi:hypothetical protein E2C01_052307 [Portunus trituberculatus]|uniref:Uncharacterized protein n=1 Tax=Portunus trituberculatus TaxID=210409 RepID=A0A5B7GL75_PORTR|nr:hypothetical protein [Portunus trituberculatus]